MSMALSPSPLMRAVGRSFGIALMAKVAALTLALILARGFGPEGYGLFAFATGAALLGGRLAALGLPTLMNRFLPAYGAAEDPAHMAGLLWLSDRLIPVTGLLAGGALAASALVLGAAHPLSPGLLLAGGLLPLMSLRSVTRAQLGALGHPAKGLSMDELIPPLGALMLVPVMTGPAQGVLGYGAASALAVGVGLIWRMQSTMQMPGPAPVARAFEFRLWAGVALPALVGMSAKLFLSKTDILMLAPLSGLQEVGHYGAALRLTYLQTTPMVVLATVLTPALSAALSAGQIARARSLYHLGLAAALVFSAPFAALFTFAPVWVLKLTLGVAYLPAAPVLAVLALAQMAAALGIVTTALMVMGGRTKLFGLFTLVALAGNIALNLWLIPLFGALGAAVTTLASMTGLLIVQAATAPLILRETDA